MNEVASAFGLLECMNPAVSLTDAILGSVSEGVLGLDRTGVVKFANESAVRMIGGETSGCVGHSIHEFLAERNTGERLQQGEARHPDACPVCRSIADGLRREVQSAVFSCSNGSRLPVTYTVTPVEVDRRVVGVILSLVDQTERKRMEAESLQLRKLEGIGRLAAGVAHEINTPTQYVNDNVHFLREAMVTVLGLLGECAHVASLSSSGQSPDQALKDLVGRLAAADLETLEVELRTAIEQTLEGLDRITGIVGALNEFLHPGADEKVSVDLNHVIENAIAVCRNEWRYVADMGLDLCEDLPAVPCYVSEFSQVMVNLVRNAAQAVAEAIEGDSVSRGRITVSTKHDDQWAEVRVSDTGIGIAPDVQQRVFDSFFTTKPVGRGTGQGLAIARSVVVAKHGGEIAVESDVGKGAVFIIRLPLRGKASEPATFPNAWQREQAT